MTGKRRLTKSLNALDALKQNNPVEFPGILGVQFKGQSLVDVPNREGYVYVRLRNNLNEVVQAYNSMVSPVFSLPVILVRDTTHNRYIIKGRDLGQYDNWGGSAYLPRHGAQHSFPEGNWGGDIVWVYDRQFMPLLVGPTSGSSVGQVYVSPDAYYWNGNWFYAGAELTPDLTIYNPATGGMARLVLVYLDGAGDVQVTPGVYFSEVYNALSDIISYVPALPAGAAMPLGAVRLTSGTSTISWSNIYDLRPIVGGDIESTTGSVGHIIQDEGTPLTSRNNLNFIGSGVTVTDDLANDATDVTISGGASTGTCFVCDGTNAYGGYGALEHLTSGYDNVAVGYNALYTGTTMFRSVAIGSHALEADNSYENTAVGYKSLLNAKDTYNTALGAWSGENIIYGTENTFLGNMAGSNALQKVDAVYSMALGADAYTTKDYQIVIGSSVITETLIRGTVVIPGDLDHDGTHIGFFGATGTTQSTGWSISNLTPDKVLDCDSTSLDEVADVLGTLINELKLKGLLGA